MIWMILTKVKSNMKGMATEENSPALEPAMQESMGRPHSPQQSVCIPPIVMEAPIVVAPRESVDT